MTGNGHNAVQTLNGDDVFIPIVKIPQPDGSVLIRPGKPMLRSAECDAKEAARILGLSVRTINYQCEMGQIRTAYKPGGRPRSKWRMARAEISDRKTSPFE